MKSSHSTTPCVCAQLLSRVLLFASPWTTARQAPLSMKFPREEYWSGLPSPPPGDLPDPGIKPTSLMSPVLAGGCFTTEPPGKPMVHLKLTQYYVNYISKLDRKNATQ